MSGDLAHKEDKEEGVVGPGDERTFAFDDRAENARNRLPQLSNGRATAPLHTCPPATTQGCSIEAFPARSSDLCQYQVGFNDMENTLLTCQCLVRGDSYSGPIRCADTASASWTARR